MEFDLPLFEWIFMWFWKFQPFHSSSYLFSRFLSIQISTKTLLSIFIFSTLLTILDAIFKPYTALSFKALPSSRVTAANLCQQSTALHFRILKFQVKESVSNGRKVSFVSQRKRGFPRANLRLSWRVRKMENQKINKNLKSTNHLKQNSWFCLFFLVS
jgi:hypothetical protein